MAAVTSSRAELPPRARRIHDEHKIRAYLDRTTSACAENTWPARLWQWSTRNYLRVRGEYIVTIVLSSLFRELPPRARRIHRKFRLGNSKLGTTSACAENTIFAFDIKCADWNYLRVRGEYWSERQKGKIIMELPPRARRIPLACLCSLLTRGTTSACAENTKIH